MGGGPHAARLLPKWIDGSGCQKVPIRPDGKGASICACPPCVLRGEGATTANEVGPPVERAILTVGGLVTTTAAVEGSPRAGVTSARISWRGWCTMPPRYSTRAQSVQMGLTPLRRVKGRKFGTPLAGCGERVRLREPPVEKVNKFDPRCVEARLLKFFRRSSRCIEVSSDGSFRLVRRVKRTGFQDRWKIGSPHDKGSTERSQSRRSVFGECAGRCPCTRSRSPKTLCLKQEDFLAHGTSDHCLGCGALIRWWPCTRAH